MIDVTSFGNAIASLKDALHAHADCPTDTFIRDASIQRFEYTYELAHKTLRRYLEETEPSPSIVAEMSFSDLIRLGYERGLLKSEWSSWRKFRDGRNATSHAYDETKAKQVFAGISVFLDEAIALLAEIKQRQDSQ